MIQEGKRLLGMFQEALRFWHGYILVFLLKWIILDEKRSLIQEDKKKKVYTEWIREII